MKLPDLIIEEGHQNLVYFVPDDNLELKLVFGIAAVIGHLFPVYTAFRGGKGIATMFGFMIGIYWQAAVVSLIVFVFTFLTSKYVSLSSIIASITFPLIVFLLPYQQIISHQNGSTSLILFSLLSWQDFQLLNPLPYL